MSKSSILLLAIIFFNCTTFVPASKDKSEQSYVVSLPKVARQTIYERTRQWIAQNFKSAKAVIEYDSKDQATVIGNTNLGTATWNLFVDGFYLVSMKVEAKEEKMRISFFNMRFVGAAKVGDTSDPVDKAMTDGMVEEVQPKLDAIRTELTKYVQVGDKTNW